MLFAVNWDFIDTSEEGSKRSLEIFQNWKPAAGADFKGFYGYADGAGGIAIVDVDSHATLNRLCAPFAPWMTFSARPILPVEESAAIGHEAIAFRESIG